MSHPFYDHPGDYPDQPKPLHPEYAEARSQPEPLLPEPFGVDGQMPRHGSSAADILSRYYNPHRASVTAEMREFFSEVNEHIAATCAYRPNGAESLRFPPIEIKRSGIMLVHPPFQPENQPHVGRIYSFTTMLDGKQYSVLPDLENIGYLEGNPRPPTILSSQPLPIVVSSPLHSLDDPATPILLNPVFSTRAFAAAIHRLNKTFQRPHFDLLSAAEDQDQRYNPLLQGFSAAIEGGVKATFELDQQSFERAKLHDLLFVDYCHLNKTKTGAMVCVGIAYNDPENFSSDFPAFYHFEFTLSRTRWGAIDWRNFGIPTPIEEL